MNNSEYKAAQAAKPCVSLIVPAYNAQEVLPRCLDSLISQTFTSFEVLVVDDGSKDRTGAVCGEYAASDPRIRLLKQKNAGPAAARNKGLEQAAGRYISFVDSDDWIEPDFLETLVRTMEEGREPACMAVCGLVLAGSLEGRAYQPPRSGTLTRAQALEAIMYADGILAAVWNKLYDASLIRKEKIRFMPDLYLCEDLVFNTRYLTLAEGGINVCERQLYHYQPAPTGAVIGQFAKKTDPRKHASEFEALCRAGELLEASGEDKNENVLRAWKARTSKAAVNTLRFMTAQGTSDPVLKKRLSRFVRANLVSYLKNPRNPASSKVSVLTACFSSKVEYGIWKVRFRNRSGL